MVCGLCFVVGAVPCRAVLVSCVCSRLACCMPVCLFGLLLTECRHLASCELRAAGCGGVSAFSANKFVTYRRCPWMMSGGRTPLVSVPCCGCCSPRCSLSLTALPERACNYTEGATTAAVKDKAVSVGCCEYFPCCSWVRWVRTRSGFGKQRLAEICRQPTHRDERTRLNANLHQFQTGALFLFSF